jgi:hypothetical protein
VFDSPFSRKPIEHEAQARQLARYIALNPPDPEGWPYAGYPGLIGMRPAYSFVDPRPIFELFGSIDCFRDFVDEQRVTEDVQLGSGFAGNRVDQ